MLYRATAILLYRPVLNPADMASASGNVPYCVEHSSAINQLQMGWVSTFGERMTYAATYSTFVAS